MRWALLLLLGGCSTALSAISDPDVDQIRPGMERRAVERIVGGPDGERDLGGGLRVITYHVTLGIPKRERLNTGSLDAAATVGGAFQGDWGCLAIIPLTITVATFVVAEGVQLGREIHRLNRGEKHDVRVTYDPQGRVISYVVVPHPD